ncbi:MAG: VWA domain-containing protein [Gammaproteobacteria bacterium]|nr:VWA domain-containing protein [Gammaproteobacteria bacterium]
MMPEKMLVDEIIRQLDQSLEVEFSFYQIEIPAEAISLLPAQQQNFVLDWVERAASINITVGYEFLLHAVEALEKLGQEMIEAWLLHAMDSYDRSGLRQALEIVRDMEAYIQFGKERTAAALYAEHEAILSHFVQGLSGRELKLGMIESALPYTDSETLFLPQIVARLPVAKDNFRLLKAMTAHLWAQTRYGSFQVDLLQQLASYADQESAFSSFHTLERIRLDACLQRELPGLHRDMQELSGLLDESLTLLPDHAMKLLQDPQATVHTTLQLLNELYDQLVLIDCCYQGRLDPDAIAETRAARIEREKALLRVAFKEIAEEHHGEESPQQQRFEISNNQQEQAHDLDFSLTLEDAPVAPPAVVSRLITSIMLDFGEVPDEYLTPAGDGEYDISKYQQQEAGSVDVWSGTYHEEGAFFYNEWDYRRRHHKKRWCALREVEAEEKESGFYAQTLHKYRGLGISLRRTFELLRGEDKLLKRQNFGDDIDIDAVVEAWPDWIEGSEMTNRLFTHMHKEERNIAVLFMVDMSGSTRGWINDAEREALILMVESLQILGDRYAIYGFSGNTRKRCDSYHIKDFDEPLDDGVRARICGIEAKDYTRMGAPIRHYTEKLNQVDARIKLLITLSDGKPDDYDLEYRGEYAIEDTRMALYEAQRAGVHTYCITIDATGHDYLPHMYGAANFTVIDKVEKLPLKIADIYRKITS